jgi:hypothetical protein
MIFKLDDLSWILSRLAMCIAGTAGRYKLWRRQGAPPSDNPAAHNIGAIYDSQPDCR